MSEGPAAAAASSPPAATPAKGKTTDYVVLFKSEDAASGSAWFVGREYVARTPKKAIELYMKDEKLTSGEFVAVPKRHWAVEKPKIVTTERLAF